MLTLRLYNHTVHSDLKSKSVQKEAKLFYNNVSPAIYIANHQNSL